MGIFSIFRRKVIARVPTVGEPVWWASKQVGCTVTEVRTDGIFIFQGGPIVENKLGRQVPDWTVAANVVNATWSDEISMWIVGQGQYPAFNRSSGQIVYPEPVLLSGESQGSFAKVG